MSDATSRLPARPSVEQLSKQAKELLRQFRAGDVGALDRFDAANSRSDHQALTEPASLADAQFVIASEHGFETWAKLKHHIEMIRPSGIEQSEQLAKMLAGAYSSGDATTIRAINSNFGTSFVWEWQAADMQRRLPRWFASASRTPELALADAQDIVAQSHGFADWSAFTASFRQLPADPRSAPIFLSTRPPFYKIDWAENRLTVQGPQSDQDWDVILEVLEEHEIPKLNAGGMTDTAMRRLTRLENLTELDVGGSKTLSDEGILQLNAA